MCTVSFLARKTGYILAMNRDEQLTRAAGLPPKRRVVKGCTVVGPSEPSGGSWIALNDAGATVSLINWYSVARRVRGDAVSRGVVVTAASTAGDSDEVAAILARLPLRRMNPFRLIGVFPATREIREWRWDLQTLNSVRHPWRVRQWISSGYDEPEAQRVRSATFRQASRQESFGTLAWLRRLHRSHAPALGPFSTCMHRADAATVSYTETVVSGRIGILRYCGTAPCRHGPMCGISFTLVRNSILQSQTPGTTAQRRPAV
jgi:hypothetical protein